MSQYHELAAITQDVLEEISRATKEYGPMNSPHEAYAVILEELEEFWDEVKDSNAPSKERMRKELIQVAAMAIRSIHDLT